MTPPDDQCEHGNWYLLCPDDTDGSCHRSRGGPSRVAHWAKDTQLHARGPEQPYPLASDYLFSVHSTSIPITMPTVVRHDHEPPADRLVEPLAPPEYRPDAAADFLPGPVVPLYRDGVPEIVLNRIIPDIPA